MSKPRLIFATNNAHKVEEIQASIGEQIEVVSLQQAGIDVDIPEPHPTLEENASEKSSFIHKLTNGNCFSEDTGLEVNALNGDPGVRSARYAGDEKSFQKNVDKLLENLKDSKDKSARFRTVISLIWDNKEYLFEGICEGTIIAERKGNGGFGYDPVFVPNGAEKTFAEMNISEKTLYSHRAKAADKLVIFLQNQA